MTTGSGSFSILLIAEVPFDDDHQVKFCFGRRGMAPGMLGSSETR